MVSDIFRVFLNLYFSGCFKSTKGVSTHNKELAELPLNKMILVKGVV